MNPQDIYKSSLFSNSTVSNGLSPFLTKNGSASPQTNISPATRSYISSLGSAPMTSLNGGSANTGYGTNGAPMSVAGGNKSATTPATPKNAYINSQVTTPQYNVTSPVNSVSSPQNPNANYFGGSNFTGAGGGAGAQPDYYRQAFDQYMQALMPTEAENQATKYLSQLNLQADQDYDKALETGETLGFASGEAQRVNRNNQYGIRAASDAVNALSGSRTARTAAAQARLDFEKSIMGDSSPIEVSPGASLFDPRTGKSVYTAPTTAGLNGTAGGGSGQSTGNVIADQVKANPALYATLTPTIKGQVLKALAASGYDTTQLTIPNLSAEQRTKIDDYDTVEREAQYALQLLDAGLNTGIIAGPAGLAQNIVGANQPFAQYNSAVSNLASILLKARSGAAVTPQEYERIKGFIPRITDDETTAKTKIARFMEELAIAKQNFIARSTQTSQQVLSGSQPSGDDEYQSYLQAIGAQ